MFKSLILVLVLILTACGGDGASSKNCDAFATQPEAQSYFRSHNASNLDRDNDGIACEHLPDNTVPPQHSTLSEFIGTYSLMGESCETGECTAQSVTLNVETDNNISICISSDIIDGCNLEQTISYEITNSSEGIYLIEDGELNFDTNETGHLTLKYKSLYFYGQNVLSTETNINDWYSQEGISINENDFRLSSKFGQSVIWNKENGITINND